MLHVANCASDQGYLPSPMVELSRNPRNGLVSIKCSSIRWTRRTFTAEAKLASLGKKKLIKEFLNLPTFTSYFGDTHEHVAAGLQGARQDVVKGSCRTRQHVAASQSTVIYTSNNNIFLLGLEWPNCCCTNTGVCRQNCGSLSLCSRSACLQHNTSSGTGAGAPVIRNDLRVADRADIRNYCCWRRR